MGHDWPLTGREEEFRLVNAAVTGHIGIVLAGPTGVGKTRLAREAATAAESRGSLVHWVGATPSARTIPFGAFAGVVDVPHTDPTQAVWRLLDELTGADGHPEVVVAIDDAHLLDPLSAFLVRQLVTQHRATALITVRSGEPSPDEVTELWKDCAVERLDLLPLSRTASDDLVEVALGRAADVSTRLRMWELSRGNALYLRHLIDDAVNDEGTSPALPTGLRDLVEARLAGLSDPEIEVVDLLALGEPVDAAVLAELTDPLALERVEARALVSARERAGRLEVRLTHPLYGEVRRDRMGVLCARRLRGQLAGALAERVGPDDRLRRAALLADSDRDADPLLFIATARAAFRQFDPTLGEHLADAAVQAGGGFHASLTQAVALMALGRGRQADDILSAMGDLAGTDVERTEVAVARTSNLLWELGLAMDAERVLSEAESSVRSAECLATLHALRAAVLAVRGRPDEAAAAASAVLGRADLGDATAMLAGWALAIGLGDLGRTDALRDEAARCYLRATHADGVPYLMLPLAHAHIGGLRRAGQIGEAVAVAERVVEDSNDATGAPEAMVATLAGQAAFAAGNLADALARLTEARTLLQPVFGNAGWTLFCLLDLTQTLAMSGRVTEATEALEELERQRHPAYTHLDPEVALAGAWVHASRHATVDARASARAAADCARALGQPAHELMALHTAVRFGDAAGRHRLRELIHIVDGPRAEASAAHAEALDMLDGDALTAASTAFERFGDRLSAADAAAHACWAFRQHGQRGSALTAGARALRIAADCGGAHTPALDAVAKAAKTMTARESEVAALVARGLSNREIADRLVVSVRTVEGHLYRLTTKLGCRDRSEVAAFLARG